MKFNSLSFTALLASVVSSQAIIDIPDQFGVEGGGAGITIVTPEELLEEAGFPIDDNFTGTVVCNFTIEFTGLANGTGEFGFTGFETYLDGDVQMGVGDHWTSTVWSGYGRPDTANGFNFFVFDSDGLPGMLETNAPETFTLTFTMVAGGDDTATILFRGEENSFVGPISFDEFRVRSGNTGQIANFTDMSVEVSSGVLDSDGDGLPDFFEQLIIDADALQNPPGSLTLADVRGPNDIPTFSDFDNDGLDDHLEFEEGTDPVLADSDGDELSDGEEVNTTLSSPLNADSDSDLLTDGEEVNVYGSDPNRFDSDDDLVSDFLEVSSGTDPLLSSERPLSTFTPRDQLNVEGGGLGTLLIDSGSIVGLIGQEIDDTLEGRIEYSFDLEFVSLANDSGDGGFTLLEVYNDGEEGFGVGNNFFDTTWTVFGAPGVGAVELLDTDGNTVPVETSAPESFTVRMDMLAGGDDTLTVTFRGQEAIFVGPISFDEVRMRSGFGGQSANLTNMSFTFTPLSSVEETGDLTLEILSVDVVDNMAELSVANVPGAGAQTFHIRSSTNLRQWIPISGSDFTSSGPLSVAPVNGIERQFFQVWEGPASN